MKSYLIICQLDKETVRYAGETGNNISIHLLHVVHKLGETPQIVGNELTLLTKVEFLTISPEGIVTFSGDVVGTDQRYYATLRDSQIIDGTETFGSFDMEPKSTTQ